MGKRLRLALVVVLAVCTVVSGALLVFAVTRPSAEYDPDRVKLDVDVTARDKVLTCAYKMYGDDTSDMWLAKTIIKNIGKIPCYDFKISYKVGDYTDWTSGEVYPEIPPGGTVRDYCWPNLNAEMISQLDTRTNVEVVVKYEWRGHEPEEDYVKVNFMGRHDVTWSSMKPSEWVDEWYDPRDNYMVVAAFVTPNDETVKQLAGITSGGLAAKYTDNDAAQAFGNTFYALRNLGVKYTSPPTFKMEGEAVQYINYPSETINRQQGTCIELAAAMAAVMEASGVKSYIALVPGHAFPVIELPESGDLLPLESTFLDKEYALSHHQDIVSPEVSAVEARDFGMTELYDNFEQGTLFLVDIQKWWEAGVVPP